MKPAAALISAMCLIPSSIAAAGDLSYGKAEYQNSCARCHGQDATGLDVMGDVLMKRPADLTVLARLNGGEFPYFRVVATIDGRYLVAAHGDRDMPIWGTIFRDEGTKSFGPQGGEWAAEARIFALADYIRSLQQP